ncbi:MAG: alpha/beta fold hydrolase [Saprospiraceae bacterium]
MKKNTFARFVGALLNGLAVVAPRPAGRLAFFLFGFPKRKKYKEKEAEFMRKAETRFERIGANEIAIYRWGTSGPIALLAHGWESNAGRWRKVATGLLRAGYQVVAVDAPAHGRSSGRHFTMLRYAGVLQSVLQTQGPVDVLIGHSVGAAACVWALGQADPTLRPKRAVVLASFASIGYIMDNTRQFVGASDRLMSAIDDHVEQVYGHRIAYYDLTETARNLADVQALLIHDRGDQVTHFAQGESLHASWPGARFWATEGYGHGLTAPEIVAGVLAWAGKAG